MSLPSKASSAKYLGVVLAEVRGAEPQFRESRRSAPPPAPGGSGPPPHGRSLHEDAACQHLRMDDHLVAGQHRRARHALGFQPRKPLSVVRDFRTPAVEAPNDVRPLSLIGARGPYSLASLTQTGVVRSSVLTIDASARMN